MLKKYIILLGAVVFLLGATINVSAVTDSTGDLFHYRQDAESVTGWSFEKYSGEKPNIDITDISYTTTDTKVTITMTVAGSIEDKEGLAYYVYMPHNTAKTGGFAYYTNGFYYEWGDTSSSANTEMTSYAGTNTITFEVDYEDPAGITDVWGYTYEVADVQASTNGEYWGDWAPDKYFAAYDQFYGDDSEGDTSGGTSDGNTGGTTENNTNDTSENTTEDNTDDKDETGNGAPGFEILTLVASVAIALILLKKRK